MHTSLPELAARLFYEFKDLESARDALTGSAQNDFETMWEATLNNYLLTFEEYIALMRKVTQPCPIHN